MNTATPAPAPAALLPTGGAGAQAAGCQWQVIATATVRNGVSLRSAAVRQLQPGTLVSVLERAQSDGHRRGRISQTEWVSIMTA
eukprot:SAG11_NODE_15259_length_583_cov_4.547521_1_plen_83_part_10